MGRKRKGKCIAMVDLIDASLEPIEKSRRRRRVGRGRREKPTTVKFSGRVAIAENSFIDFSLFLSPLGTLSPSLDASGLFVDGAALQRCSVAAAAEHT